MDRLPDEIRDRILDFVYLHHCRDTRYIHDFSQGHVHRHLFELLEALPAWRSNIIDLSRRVQQNHNLIREIAASDLRDDGLIEDNLAYSTEDWFNGGVIERQLPGVGKGKWHYMLCKKSPCYCDEYFDGRLPTT